MNSSPNVALMDVFARAAATKPPTIGVQTTSVDDEDDTRAQQRPDENDDEDEGMSMACAF
jgi:hypothetical protein